jgi:arginyl-tRNA synthetase
MQHAADILRTTIHSLYGLDSEISVERPASQFGDVATNVALQLAGKLGRNPREIAEEIAGMLRESGDFAEIIVAGPGFINLRLSDAALIEQALRKPTRIHEGKVIVTEYSDPNPFKVLHAGHLYTSIVGDVISNLLANAGAIVHRVNFGGDVGLHVGKTMWAILRSLGGEHPEKLTDIPENERSQWMATCYVEGTRAYEDDETAKSEIISINKVVYALHTNNDHESALAQIYWTCRQWSYDYFSAFYERIGTPFEKYYPESQAAPVGLRTVKAHTRGAPENTTGQDVFIYSDAGSEGNTVIFHGEDYDLHTRVFINSEGLPTYEAKDVGLSILKWDDYHFDESIIITGNDITEYMKVVLKAIEQFNPELAERTRHITHGNVKLAGGVKMSSRKGNFLRALDVIDIAAEANEEVVGNRDEQVVLAAIRYSFLKSRIGGDIIFEPKESVSLQGNSGPYLQYAHARACSILEKAVSAPTQIVVGDVPFDAGERLLVRKIGEYAEVVERATEELLPHQICTYLYELAQEFNRFYEQSRIIGDEREKLRLSLVVLYRDTLASGLSLLGIAAPGHL